MNGESIAGQCISHHFSCLPNLIPKKRDSSHGNRDKEGRVGMSSFKSSGSSGEREVAVEVAVEVAEMSASAGGKQAGMKLRRGRRDGINKQTRCRKRSSPPGFDPPSTPSPEAHTPTPPPAARRCEGGDFTGVTSQGKQFHRRRVLLQELPFGKFGPLGS